MLPEPLSSVAPGIVDRSSAVSMWTDVFERVLDKGVVMDPSHRAALSGGIDLKAGHVRIAIVSIEVRPWTFIRRCAGGNRTLQGMN